MSSYVTTPQKELKLETPDFNRSPEPRLEIDRDLISQLRMHLSSLDELVSRLHFFVDELKTDSELH
jgi:hypothetical protein